jgi:hypothetical protein
MTDTLKSICEQCLQLSAPKLDFLPAAAERHADIIRRDLKELVAAASAEHAKSVVLLAGSLLESILYGFLSGQETFITAIRGAEFVFDPRMSLQNYKEVFNRYFNGAIRGSALPDIITSYRDITHINRELALPDDICARASRELLRTLDKLLADLTAFAGSSSEVDMDAGGQADNPGDDDVKQL